MQFPLNLLQRHGKPSTELFEGPLSLIHTVWTIIWWRGPSHLCAMHHRSCRLLWAGTRNGKGRSWGTGQEAIGQPDRYYMRLVFFMWHSHVIRLTDHHPHPHLGRGSDCWHACFAGSMLAALNACSRLKNMPLLLTFTGSISNSLLHACAIYFDHIL